MIRRQTAWIFLAIFAVSSPAGAQEPLTLTDAIARARANNPEARGAAAAELEADARATQARAGYLPRIELVETWQRSNQPVFVFGSLLGQRRFTEANFAVHALNNPDPLNNFRSTLLIEQSLFDGATRPKVTTARIGRDLAAADRVRVSQDLAERVTDAYGRVLVAAAANQSAAAAAERAAADRELAGNRRDAGLVTDADVLQLDLSVSRAREQQIRAASDERIARASLNQLMGEPLETRFTLDRGVAEATIDVTDTAALEREALRNRPDVKAATLREQLAAASHRAAKAAFLPQVSAQAGWEFNGDGWNPGGRESNWIVGAVARINLFNGFADKARVVEAREQMKRRAFERAGVETAARLDLLTAMSRLDAARASEAAGKAAVAQARESQRIIRDRYESGLADVTALLRAAEAVVEAEKQQVAAQVEVVTRTAALQRALGRQ